MEIEKIEAHEYANIFPMMGEVDFNNLKNDISQNGYDETRPILTHENKILDGRNRYKVCQELGIKPTIEKYQGNEPLQFVISINLNRRHLTESQRATIAVDVVPMFEIEAKKREFGGIPVPKVEQGRSVDKAGKIFNVGKTYVSEAKKLKELRPDLFEEVKQGRKKLSEVVAEVRKAEKIRTIKEQVKDIIDSNIICGDCLSEIPKLKDNSVACLIIDPPYGIDYQSNHKLAKHDKMQSDNQEAINLLDKSLELVKPKMLDDSHIYIFTHWKVFEIVKPIVEKYFEVKNVLIWNKNNWSMGDLSGNYAEKYEMIIFASQGKRILLGENRPVNVLDFARTNNSNHPTEKPVNLLKELIKNSTIEKELVLDYFAGSGSTCLASKELNRKYVGIEKEKQYADLIKVRLNKKGG